MKFIRIILNGEWSSYEMTNLTQFVLTVHWSHGHTFKHKRCLRICSATPFTQSYQKDLYVCINSHFVLLTKASRLFVLNPAGWLLKLQVACWSFIIYSACNPLLAGYCAGLLLYKYTAGRRGDRQTDCLLPSSLCNGRVIFNTWIIWTSQCTISTLHFTVHLSSLLTFTS